jgi:hypothetical protein
MPPHTECTAAVDAASASTAGWTPARIRGLGAVTDITTAGAILGLSRSAAYDLAHRGEFPIPVIRAGSRYRVPVAALHIPLAPEPADATRPVATSTGA